MRFLIPIVWSNADTAIFITQVVNFWKFLDSSWLKFSVNGKGLSTSVHYKPVDSRSYPFYQSSCSQQRKNSTPLSQFSRMKRPYTDDSDFAKRGENLFALQQTRLSISVVNAGKQHAEDIDWNPTQQTSMKRRITKESYSPSHFPHKTTQSEVSLSKRKNK